MCSYLDTCCYNRPFDDQAQARIRLEAEAVVRLLGRVESGELVLVGGFALEYEILRAPESDRRSSVLRTARRAGIRPVGHDTPRELIHRIGVMGFDMMDAVHLATAVAAGYDVFYTVDDQLLRLAVRNAQMLPVRVTNPAKPLRDREKEMDR